MFVKSARKHETTCEHFGRLDPLEDGFTSVFRQFELNRLFGLSLDHGNTFPYLVILHQVAHLKFDQMAAAQLAVDGDVEQGKV